MEWKFSGEALRKVLGAFVHGAEQALVRRVRLWAKGKTRVVLNARGSRKELLDVRKYQHGQWTDAERMSNM